MEAARKSYQECRPSPMTPDDFEEEFHARLECAGLREPDGGFTFPPGTARPAAAHRLIGVTSASMFGAAVLFASNSRGTD
jgi:hypothetical protein